MTDSNLMGEYLDDVERMRAFIDDEGPPIIGARSCAFCGCTEDRACCLESGEPCAFVIDLPGALTCSAPRCILWSVFLEQGVDALLGFPAMGLAGMAATWRE